MWALNPMAHKQLATFAKPAGILFLLLAAMLALAGTGWFKQRLWGWRLAVAVIATQVLGDLVNFFRGDYWRGGVGFSIASALLCYLLRPAVRTVFDGAILK
jgi:membrane protein implicated in regulation of membrane protease activity